VIRLARKVFAILLVFPALSLIQVGGGLIWEYICIASGATYSITGDYLPCGVTFFLGGFFTAFLAVMAYREDRKRALIFLLVACILICVETPWLFGGPGWCRMPLPHKAAWQMQRRGYALARRIHSHAQATGAYPTTESVLQELLAQSGQDVAMTLSPYRALYAPLPCTIQLLPYGHTQPQVLPAAERRPAVFFYAVDREGRQFALSVTTMLQNVDGLIDIEGYPKEWSGTLPEEGTTP